MELIYKEEAYKIIGAAMEVHTELGCGFLEAIYQEALEIEFQKQGIPYEREKLLSVRYKDVELKKKYFADFVCYDKIIVEVKALSDLTKQDESQVLNYLNATELRLGLLFNFGRKSLQYKRLVF
jgi:GxxExxY protein